MFLNKDRKKYDWVLDYLKDDKRLEASPYLWTRLKANIESENKISRTSVFGKIQLLSQWIFSIGLVVSITLGVFVGHELSAKVCSQAGICPKVVDISNGSKHDFILDEEYDGLSEERF